jgi:hypothetical protein
MAKNDPASILQTLSLKLDIKELSKIGKDKTQEYADFLAEDIKKRTRLGYGVENNGDEKEKFKPLKSSTKESKKRHQAKGQLSEYTSPNKSNLTDTGRMTENIKGKGLTPTSGEVFVDGERNKEIAGYHEVGGGRLPKRPFLHADRLQIKRLTDFIRKDILDKIKKATS